MIKVEHKTFVYSSHLFEIYIEIHSITSGDKLIGFMFFMYLLKEPSDKEKRKCLQLYFAMFHNVSTSKYTNMQLKHSK